MRSPRERATIPLRPGWIACVAVLVVLGGGTPRASGAARQGTAQAVCFDEFFESGALRLDIIHAGNFDSDEISLRRIVREPMWSGSPAGLIPQHDRGKYRLDVFDDRSGRLIYRHGFSTLFGEWQATQAVGGV